MVEFIKIDEKDRKILVELDKNARQTDSTIAKKVGISKQVANYRIQGLVDKNLISKFYTVVNVGKLGLNSYYLFLQLENTNKEREKEIMGKLSELDYVGWIVTGVGRWDVALLIYADSISIFDSLLNKTMGLCKGYLHEYNFTTLITGQHVSYKVLGEHSTDILKQTEKSAKVKLDKIDLKILERISQDARISIVELSEKTKEPLHVINYHLKNMLRQKIIEGFKPKVNINLLGYQWHLLLIQLHGVSEKRKEEFIDFCKNHKKVYYVTNTIGLYNLMLDIHVKSVAEFRELLMELKEKFSDIIKLYESMVIFDEQKIDYFPKNLV